MKSTWFCVMVVVILAGALPLGLAAQAGGLSYYSGGSGKIRLDTALGTFDYSADLAGASTEKTLLMVIQKDAGTQRRLVIPLSSDGRFHLRWLFKDGPGNYTITFFGSPRANSLSYSGLAYGSFKVTGNLPADYPGLMLNQKIMDYVNSVLGTQVGRGECWDLAQEALDLNLADWSRPLVYGRRLNPNVDLVLPGDIIQFNSVTVTEKLANGGTRWETLGAPDHTAVIYEVKGPLQFRLAHQNLGGKRFVQITDLDLNKMSSGQFWIYRPEVAALVLPE